MLAELGISKKLLKTKIKERSLYRKADKLTHELEADELNEYEMLSAKLGDFASTGLGAAALESAKPQEHTLRSVGL